MGSFLLILQIILVSLISSTTSSSSGRVLYTSNISLDKNESVSIVVADMSAPKLLPNGKYDECVVFAGISVFRPYLERKAVLNYASCHYTERIFASAVEAVFFKMDVDINILLPAMIKSMAKEYAEMAKLFFRRNEAALLDQDEVESSRKNAVILVIFIHESISSGYKFTDEQNMIFLEFIYRCSPGGFRYTLAFQGLCTSLKTEIFLAFYELAVKYFDPVQPALPVFFFNFSTGENDHIKIAFSNFLVRLYKKLIEFKPVLHADQFNIHANMLISSMISCNFVEDFIPMLFDLLQNVDLNKLLCSTRFSKSARNLIKDLSPSSSIFVFFSNIFVNDNFISALDESNFLNYGAIFQYLDSESYLLLLSSEASERLIKIRLKFDKYAAIFVDGFEMLESIEDNFINMDKSQLERLELSIESQISNSDDFFSYHQSDASNYICKLLGKISILAKNAIRYPSTELDVERYKVLLKLIEMVLSVPAALDTASDSVSIVLFFYNVRVSKLPNVKTLLAGSNDLMLELLHKLVKKNRFFSAYNHRTILYSYLQLTRSDEAEAILSDILLRYLRVKPNKQAAITEVLRYAIKFKICLNSIFSIYLFTEIQNYFDSSPKISIETYEDGLLVEISKTIVGMKVLNKTEQLFVKSFCNQFSANRNIFP